MANNPERIVVWPGYFDSKTSRRSGRRVSKDRAVANPTLDGLAYATRSAGIRKIQNAVMHSAIRAESEYLCAYGAATMHGYDQRLVMH